MNRRDAIKAAIGAVGAAALAPAVSEGQEFTTLEFEYQPRPIYRNSRGEAFNPQPRQPDNGPYCILDSTHIQGKAVLLDGKGNALKEGGILFWIYVDA